MRTAEQETSLLERFAWGLLGGFLGAVVGFLAAFWVEEYIVHLAVVGAVVCFAAAFALGDKVVARLIEVLKHL